MRQSIMESDKNSSGSQLSDLFNIQKMQEVQDAFSKATGVASLIIDVAGKPITKASNYCNVCEFLCSVKGGAEKCIRSDDIIEKSTPAGANLRPCFITGLWHASVKISVGGTHRANWLLGPVLVDDGQEEHVLRYAQEIGARPCAEITHMSLERFKNIYQVLLLTVDQLSKLATRTIKNKNEIKRLSKAKRLQEALYQISETVSSSRNLEELYKSVHGVIATLISAKNLYIAIMDEDTGMLHFPYRVDERGGNPGSRKLTNGLVEYVIRLGLPLLIDPKMRCELVARGDIRTIGTCAGLVGGTIKNGR